MRHAFIASMVLCLVETLALTARAEAPLPRVPKGFEVELAAAPPVVERPVMANFDDSGRLYVVDSAGVNLRFEELLKNPPHRIVILDDTNGDGRFDKRTVFADKLVMPQGVLWHKGVAYVASPPSVWRLEDTNGDSVADRRQEIVTEFGSNGNAADVHGPFLGPDGWLYLCDGRHGHKVKRADGSIDEGLAAGIFRFRTDGSGFERVCGGGFDNPVEVDFTPEGEMLGTVNILLGSPRVDCLMHWIEGGVYPRHDQEQCIAEYKRTGDLMPPLAQLGHVAVSGMSRYRSNQFGPEYKGNVFMAIFNTHKVVRSILERSGATFRSREEEFLVSDDQDSHFTDILEDADGSLLAVNTGGWFRIGCPQSQIAKPEMLGSIFRIRRTGAPRIEDPRGLALKLAERSPTELAGYLNDPRPAVRERTVTLLAAAGAPAVPVLKTILSEAKAPAAGETINALAAELAAESPRNAVWALSQMESVAAAQPVLVAALGHPSESVRIAAARAAGMTGNREAIGVLTRLVVKDTPPVRRDAATALGRLCHAGRELPAPFSRGPVVTALVESLRLGVTDRFLEHALLFALIQIADRDATLAFLQDTSPQVRRGALLALDQMHGGNLTRELVAPLLDTEDPPLRNAALAVIGARKGWGGELLTLLRGWLQSTTPSAEQISMLRGVLIAQAADAAIQQLVSETLASARTTPALRLLLWEVVYRAPLEKLPEAWLSGLATALQQGTEEERRQVIAILQDRELPTFDGDVLKLAGDEEQPLALRIDALVAAAPRMQALSEPFFKLLKGGLRPDTQTLERLAAARALGEAPLSSPQLIELAEALPDAGPLVVPVLLRAFARSQAEPVGLALIAALNRSAAGANLSPDELGGMLRKYPATVQAASADLLRRLGGDGLEKQKARLAELGGLLAAGDAKRGREVFFGKKAACSGCHTVAAQGGRVGPDLTKIGAIRTGVDLLEAIVFPSASFARDYRPYTIATESGKVYTGVVTRQASDAIYLRTAELAEIRIPRKAIEEMRESNTSIMPKGLDTTLTPDELRDLLAFLKELK